MAGRTLRPELSSLSLPSLDTRVYLAELSKLQWMGEASRLQQPGDFITSLVTDRPFVACVDQQGQLKAYHNVRLTSMYIPCSFTYSTQACMPSTQVNMRQCCYRFAGIMLLLYVMKPRATLSSLLAHTMAGYMVRPAPITACLACRPAYTNC